MGDSVKFNPEIYETKACSLNNRIVRYRAYENLKYCACPPDPIQKLNLFVPQDYYEGKQINGYTLKTVPIFVPNTVGGYMPGAAAEPGTDWHGNPNTIFAALEHGYVVASAGIRGRSSADGKAPALIADMKAVIRYLRYNKKMIPGDTEKIITNGTSAGGALSALAGAAGNSDDYNEELKKIGVADAPDHIFAASCYCPIHNLEHADAAYEWQFCGHDEYSWHGKSGVQTPEQQQVSKELKALFPPYVNSLGLLDEAGTPLYLDDNGEGTFLEYVKKQIAVSAQKELDWAAFLAEIGRMKTAPAFDVLDLSSVENDEFGTEDTSRKHFTQYSFENSKKNGMLAEAQIIKMMNPLEYIDGGGCAKYWRIRHGTHDRDTSFAIPVILATALKNRGYDVDFWMPWGVPHSGDYDLDELFAWIDRICRGRSWI